MAERASRGRLCGPAIAVDWIAIQVKALQRSPKAACVGVIHGVGLGIVTCLAHAHQAGQGRECRAALGNGDDMVHRAGQHRLATALAWLAHRLG